MGWGGVGWGGVRWGGVGWELNLSLCRSVLLLAAYFTCFPPCYEGICVLYYLCIITQSRLVCYELFFVLLLQNVTLAILQTRGVQFPYNTVAIGR